VPINFFNFCSDEETEFLILPDKPIKNELSSSEDEVTEDDEVNDPDFFNEEDSWDEGPPAKQRKSGSGRPRKYKTKEERKAAKNAQKREMTRKKPRPAYGKHNSPCPLCDLVLPSNQERFFHVENVHYPGQGEEVKGALHIYSRVCGKRSMTPSDSDLTEHNERHHPEHLRFVCDLCPGKKFVKHTQLDAHKVIHLGQEGPFKCLLCPPGEEQSFTEATDLDKHLGRVHIHHMRWRNGAHQTKVKNQIPGVCDNPKLHETGVKGLMSQFIPCRFCGVKLTKDSGALSTTKGQPTRRSSSGSVPRAKRHSRRRVPWQHARRVIRKRWRLTSAAFVC